MTATDQSRDATRVIEDVIKLLVAVLILAASFYGSFRHMHEWTVTALQRATDQSRGELSWYGWANAVISELLVVPALLSLRRKIAARQRVAWSLPLVLLVASIVLSVGAQIAWVCLAGHPNLSAIFLAVLPAAAAAVLVKLLMSDLDTLRSERKLDEEADRKRLAMIADFRSRIAQAEAEAEAARRAEAEALAEAEGARERERKALTEAEAARADRAQLRGIAEEEAQRFESLASAEAAARRDAEASARRLRIELEQTRAAQKRAEEELAVAQELLDTAPVSAPPNNVTQLPRHRKPAEIVIPDVLPPIEGVGAERAEEIAQVMRDNPNLSQKEVAALVGTTDRTVRNFVKGLAQAQTAV